MTNGGGESGIAVRTPEFRGGVIKFAVFAEVP